MGDFWLAVGGNGLTCRILWRLRSYSLPFFLSKYNTAGLAHALPFFNRAQGEAALSPVVIDPLHINVDVKRKESAGALFLIVSRKPLLIELHCRIFVAFR